MDGGAIDVTGSGAYGIQVNSGCTATINGGSVSSQASGINDLGTVNVNGGSVSGSPAIYLTNGTGSTKCALNVSGGTITSSGVAIRGTSATNGIDVTMTAGTVTGTSPTGSALSAIQMSPGWDVTLSGGTIACDGDTSYGVLVAGSSTLTVDGNVSISGSVAGIASNGTADELNSKAVISISAGNISGALGLYLPSVGGKTTISGGTITGSRTGVEVRAGSLEVTGGDITSTATTTEVISNGNGPTVTGAAIAVSQHTTGESANASVSLDVQDGTFKGPWSVAVVAPQTNDTLAQGSDVSLSGGLFDGAVHTQDGLKDAGGADVSGFVHGGVYTEKPATDLIDPSSLAVSKPGDDWYVGDDADGFIDQLQPGDTLEVANAPKDITVPEGVTVDNQSGGVISVNDQTVQEGGKPLVTSFNVTPESVSDLKVGATQTFTLDLTGIDGVTGVTVSPMENDYVKVTKVAEADGVWTFEVEGLAETPDGQPVSLTVTLEGAKPGQDYIFPAGVEGWTDTVDVAVVAASSDDQPEQPGDESDEGGSTEGGSTDGGDGSGGDSGAADDASDGAGASGTKGDDLVGGASASSADDGYLAKTGDDANGIAMASLLVAAASAGIIGATRRKVEE